MLGLLVNRQAKSINTDGGRFLEVVLPDADDFPALAAELAGHGGIQNVCVCPTSKKIERQLVRWRPSSRNHGGE